MIKASLEDAFLLTEIARSAKASLGYEKQLLHLWKQELTITPSMVDEMTTYVAINEKETLGFCMISLYQGHAEIEHLWVRPEDQKKGIGDQLIRKAIEHGSQKADRLLVISDPLAAPFYMKYGFERIGEVESIPSDRKLPQLQLSF